MGILKTLGLNSRQRRCKWQMQFWSLHVVLREGAALERAVVTPYTVEAPSKITPSSKHKQSTNATLNVQSKKTPVIP